jgi:hypothetical protein
VTDIKRVEHTGKFLWEEGPLALYEDSIGVRWSFASVDGNDWAAAIDASSGTDAGKYPPDTTFMASTRDELRGKVDRAADDVWYSKLLTEKKTTSGGGGLALLALLAFGGGKRKRKRR